MRPWNPAYPLLRAGMHLLRHLFLFRSLHVRGRDNIPRRGGVLVVANHIATVDPPLTGALIPRLDVHYMAKSEHFQRGRTWLFRGYNAFPVIRHSADRAALKRALHILREGHVLLLYPEGSRSEDHRLHRPRGGAGFIARRSGAPIIPAAIWGSENALPKGARWPRHATVNLHFGQPFHLPERNPDGTRMTHQQTVEYMMARVAALLPEGYRGVYAPGEELAAVVPPAA